MGDWLAESPHNPWCCLFFFSPWIPNKVGGKIGGPVDELRTIGKLVKILKQLTFLSIATLTVSEIAPPCFFLNGRSVAFSCQTAEMPSTWQRELFPGGVLGRVVAKQIYKQNPWFSSGLTMLTSVDAPLQSWKQSGMYTGSIQQLFQKTLSMVGRNYCPQTCWLDFIHQIMFTWNRWH